MGVVLVYLSNTAVYLNQSPDVSIIRTITDVFS